MRVKVIGYWLLVIVSLAFSSCRNDIVYSQFHSISYPDGTITSSENWHMDSVVRFDFPIPDTTLDYTVTIYLRHTEHYPYQNIWLFVGDSAACDSINIALADDRGVWYGESHNGFMEMPIVFGENIHYADTGSYHLMIQHGMRDTMLRGVTEVGLEISK